MTINLIEHNPLLKKPVLALLALCDQHPEADRSFIENAADELWEASYSQSPAVVVDILVRSGALEEQVLADGQPYEGTIQDMQLDPEIADDVVAQALLSVTPEGADLLESYAAENTLHALLAEKPQYEAAFQTVLAACAVEGGCARADLEQALGKLPQLQPDPHTKQTAVYPQFFIDALETAGGIAWDGAWRTTEAGRAAVSL